MWLRDALTEVNGKSFDLKRLSAASFLLGFHVNQIYAVFWRHSEFVMRDYALSVGLMLASLGAAIALGRTAEAPVAQ